MRRRFSLKTMLAVVTFTAIAVFAGQHAYRLQTAQDELEYAQALWEVGRIDEDSLLAAERKLYEVEGDVPWIPRRRAVGNHIRRLEEIFNRLEARFQIGLFADGHEERVESLARLKEQIATLRSDSAR